MALPSRSYGLWLIWLWILAAIAAADSPLGGEFSLSRDAGQAFHLSDARGKVVLMLFGYTHCPDVCPDTLARIKVLMAKLGPDADRVQPLFISVDPERDSSTALANYVHYFDPRIVGLTGTREQIDQVVQQYHAQYRLLGTGDSYAVDHTAHLFVIDHNWKLARILPYGLPIEELITAVKGLLPPNKG
jgi:protein SCO1/2